MGKRHPNWRLAKKNRNYSVQDMARLWNLHKNTVRAWVKAGLKPIDDSRPALFHGEDIHIFLQSRRAASKRPCAPGEIYCLPCRAPMRPAGDMAEYIAFNNMSGNLRGICPSCDRLIHRRARQTKLPAIGGNLQITITAAPSRIGATAKASVNCDSKPRGPT